MSDSYDRWHGSVFFEKVGAGIGYGAGIFATLFGISCIVGSCRGNPPVREAKVDGKNVKYCDVNGRAAIIEVDGVPVMDMSKLEKSVQKEAEKK